MAATWPSIMPLGATTSAPASAWASATRRVELEGGVVVDLAVGAEHAAVAVVGVLVEAEVGHEHDLVAHRVAQRGQGAAGRSRRGPRPRCPWASLVAGHPEEDQPGDAQRGQALGLDHQRVDGVLHLAGHGGDGHAARRCPRARTAGPPGRRRQGGSRPPAGAAPGCAAAGAGGGRGSPPASQRTSCRPSSQPTVRSAPRGPAPCSARR